MWLPQHFPKMGAALNPLFRTTVRGAYNIRQKTQEMMAEAHEVDAESALSNDYARRQVRVALRNMKYFKMNVPSRLGSDPPQDRHVRSRSFVSGPRSTLTT